MTDVVVLGFDPPPGSVPGSDVLLSPRRAPVEDLFELIAGRIHEGSTVVGVHPAWEPDPWARHLELVRSALERPRLIPLPLDLPPLAGSVTAGLLAWAGRDRDAALTVAGVAPLGDAMRSMALLASVSTKAHLPVSLGTQLRSFVPGVLHLAVLEDGQARLTTVRRRDDLQLPLPPPDEDHQVAVAAAEGRERGMVRRALSAAGWDARSTQVGATTLGPRWWGTERPVEIVLHPAREAALAACLADLPDGVVCDWCRRRSPRLPCVYCGSRQSVGMRS